MKRFRQSIFYLVLMFLTAPLYAGIVYYVDGATGSDTYSGTQSLPWKTIQKAANVMVAGDTVLVSAGVYPERITITKSGSDGSLIYFLASGIVECRGFTVMGNYIRVRGFKVTAIEASWNAPAYGIWVEGKYCEIEDNYAYYNPRGGINLRPSSANCIVRFNRCQRNGNEGMGIHGSNNLVEYNEVWGSVAYHTPTGCTGDADGIRFFGSGHTFRGNYIHDIYYDDPENKGYSPHIDGFQTWAGQYFAAASNILIERNLIVFPLKNDSSSVKCGWMFEACSYIIIRNNIVIAQAGTNTGGGGVHHLIIKNNTFIGSLAFQLNQTYYPFGINLENCPYSTVRNNIVFDQADTSINLQGTTYTGLDIGNNCTYNSDGTIPRGTPYPYDLWGINPLFVNTTNYNFHLKIGSPCINAGATISDVTDDYDNNPRPSGVAYDIGAFEYQGGSAPAITTQPQSQAIQSGQTAALNVSAAGTGPITYQWYMGTSGNTSNPISGAISSLYTTNSLTANTNYWVRVSNTYGNADSTTTVINVCLPPTVTTAAVGSSTPISAVGGGTVTSDGGAAVTARGVCWGSSANPTTANSKTTDGSGTGSFASSIAPLLPSSAYHARAYATNAVGTAYGNDVTFATIAWIAGTKNDFNGDGKTDILWRHETSGSNIVWYMDGATFLGYAYLRDVADLNWKIVGTGDFNGDGKVDILWRHASSGSNIVWYMDGTTFLGYAYLRDVADLNWKIVGTGDFNGDGKVDILWRHETSGSNIVWYMDGTTFLSYEYLTPVADLN